LDSGRWFSIRYVYMVGYKDIAKIGVERERGGGGKATILLQLQANALLHVSDQCPDDDK
jgi:hypothetical protein